MKILVVPDIHGSWKNNLKFIEDNKDSVDYVVTLGDYVDDWEDENNGLPMVFGFKKLVEYARAEPSKFKLCIGNHDQSYYSNSIHGSQCSGHKFQFAHLYKEMFEENIDLLNAAVEIDGIIFSHAGVSIKWWNKISKDNFSVTKLNELVKSSPNGTVKHNVSILDHCTYSPSGDFVGESCIWIRPRSLISDEWPECKCQIVGHTEMGLSFYKLENKKLIVCDSSEHDCGFILDTEKIESLNWVDLKK